MDAEQESEAADDRERYAAKWMDAVAEGQADPKNRFKLSSAELEREIAGLRDWLWPNDRPEPRRRILKPGQRTQ